MPSQDETPKRVRLNMRIPEALLKWAKKHVRGRNTNLTQDYIDWLTSRKQQEESNGKE